MTTDAHILIDLDTPPRLNGQPVRLQSLWLLLRICHAQRAGLGGVEVSTLQARFPGGANLRMLVSRAFSDFSAWGVQVGWGQERGLPPSLLSARGRSRGPFWMDAASAARIRIRANGKRLDMQALERFLGIPAAGQDRQGRGYLTQDVTYWSRLTQAMRLAQDGLPLSSGTTVAGSFRAAQQSAQDDFQMGLALLKEGLAWRRHGNIKRSSEALARLARVLQPASAGAPPAVAAMAFVARAWNWYSGGDAVKAAAELDRLAADAELQPVIRYNPRVRFEYLNLRALLFKGTALGESGLARGKRMDAAARAMDALSDALQAAYEADSVEAAQDVAANIGWTLWLCWRQKLLEPDQQDAAMVQAQALRWLALSEWICDRFGVGGNSAWNTIFILRIARGCCDAGKTGDIDGFRAQKPLSVQQALEATRPFHAPFSRAKGYARWSTVAAFALEEHDAGRAGFGPLQLANLLLEAAWFSAHEKGLCREAYDAVERLRQAMRELRPGERRFFRDSLKELPAALFA